MKAVFTEFHQRILDYITWQNSSGIRPSVRDVQKHLKKRGYTVTHKMIGHLKLWKKITFDEGEAHSIRIRGKLHPLTMQRVFIVGEKTSWPLKPKKGVAYETVWLNARMFPLKAEAEYIVLKVGALWSPRMKVEHKDLLIVEREPKQGATCVFYNQTTLDTGILTASSHPECWELKLNQKSSPVVIPLSHILGHIVARIQYSSF